MRGEFVEVGHRTNPLRRSIWSNIAYGLTFYIPNFVLSWFGFKTQESIQAWREKTSHCIILLISSVLFLFILEVLPRIICSRQLVYTYDKIKDTSLVIIHGKVVDFGSSTSPVAQFAGKYPGQDISSAFPRYSLLARHQGNSTYPSPAINACIVDPVSADAWLTSALTAPGYIVENFRLVGCPDPNGASNPSVPCFFSVHDLAEVKKSTVADLVYEVGDIDSSSQKQAVINSKVYDIERLISPQLAPDNTFNQSRLLFPHQITELIRDSQTEEAAQQLNLDPEWPKYQQCLGLLFLKGQLQPASILGVDLGCQFWTFPLFLTMIPFIILIFKMVLSFGPFQSTLTVLEGRSSCILLIPCFNETKYELEKCITSVVETNYIDHGKLLVVICDGVTCLDSVLEIFGHQGHQGASSEIKTYQSVGVNEKKNNCAQIFSGYHYCGSHGVPYIVIVKTGNSTEVGEFVGNRGKRDSLLLILNFLDGVSSPDNLLTPIEAELSDHIQHLDLDPLNFSYLFCIDADIQADPDSLPILLHYLDDNPGYMAVSGQVLINPAGNLIIDALQKYWAFSYRHQVMNSLSALGGLTYLDGGFVAYRLQQATGTQCLTHEDIVYTLSNKRTNTLHTKHMILLGEEQYISTLLLQRWPSLKLGYVPEAQASTSGHATFNQLLYRARRTFCSRFHNLIDLCPTAATCGFNPITSLFVLGELVWTLSMPVFTVYLYFQIVRTGLIMQIPYLILPILGCLLLILKFLHAFINYRIGLVPGLIVYLVIGIPFYYVCIPVYSFLTMDTFFWYDLGGVQTRPRLHGALEDKSFRSNPASVQLNPGSGVAEKASYQTNDSNLLPEPAMFQSLYSELNKMGIPIDMPRDTDSFINSRSGRVSSAFSPGSIRHESAVQLPPLSFDQRHSLRPNVLSIFPQHQQNFSNPKNNNPVPSWQQDFLNLNVVTPSYINKVNGSDPPTGLAQGFPLPPNTPEMKHSSFGHSIPVRFSSYSASHLDSKSSPSELNSSNNRLTFTSDFNSLNVSGVPERLSSDPDVSIQNAHAMIREEIYHFLRDADLHTVTRRLVKEHLLSVFGENITFYQDFVSQCIKEFTLEKLAKGQS